MSGTPEPIHFAEIDSTNVWALANAEALPDGQWVYADRQTAGRGRRGRAWSSPAGNLHASLVLKPQPDDPPRQQLSFVAAVALRDAAAALLPDAADLKLKWPNDLLLGGRKLSGILLESAGDAVVAGFGVNLAHHPADAERPATSFAARGVHVAPAAMLTPLAEAFAQRRAQWRAEGFAPLRADWLAHAALIGERIAVRGGAETLEGRFEALEADGTLRLRLADGSARGIHAGDLFGLSA